MFSLKIFGKCLVTLSFYLIFEVRAGILLNIAAGMVKGVHVHMCACLKLQFTVWPFVFYITSTYFAHKFGTLDNIL